MLFFNRILNELGIDSEEFFFCDNVTLYYKNDPKPFGQVIYKNGHYKLKVGDVEESIGRRHVIG